MLERFVRVGKRTNAGKKTAPHRLRNTGMRTNKLSVGLEDALYARSP